MTMKEIMELPNPPSLAELTSDGWLQRYEQEKARGEYLEKLALALLQQCKGAGITVNEVKRVTEIMCERSLLTSLLAGLDC